MFRGCYVSFLFYIVAIFLFSASVASAKTYSITDSFDIELERYVRASGGYSYAPDKVNKRYEGQLGGSAFIDFGLGYEIQKYFRTDLVVSHRLGYKYFTKKYIDEDKTDYYIEKQNIDSTAIMWSGYFDFKHFKEMIPYVGFGMGFSINKAGDYYSDGIVLLGDHSRNFIWQFGGGILFKVRKDLYIDLMYKYIDLGDIKMKKPDQKNWKKEETIKEFGNLKGKLNAHEISVGAIYKF